MAAVENLINLNALEADEKLSTVGRIMLTLPGDIQTSRIIVESIQRNCVAEVLGIINLMNSNKRQNTNQVESNRMKKKENKSKE